MKDETVLAALGMACATAIGLAAIVKGYDHTIIASISTLIGVIIGYAYGKGK